MTVADVHAHAPTRDAVPANAALASSRYRRLTGWSVWLVIAANAAVIIWLWLHGGGISAVHSAGDLETSIGRLTGLVSAYQALIQVVLLARLPWLERLAGFDRLTVWHRLNGKICIILVLAHVVFITSGYAAMDRISFPHELTVLLSSYPGMISATVGTGLMIAVVVTSLVIVRRRTRYEVWYAVHLMAYAAIALAWIHQVPTGNEFAINATAADYWMSLYIATLVLLVVFRIIQPVLAACWYQMRVEAVTVEAPTVVSLHISGRHLDRLRTTAGQFFLWRFLTWNRWWEAHPFSLSAVPDGGSLRITVKSSGDFTSRIGEIRPGTRVVAEGPLGVFTHVVRRSDRAVLIAGGIGITPIRALLETLPGNLVLIYRVMHERDLVFRGELDRLAVERAITVHYVVGDHRVPGAERLLSPEHLCELVPDVRQRDVYLCGPPGMTRVLERNVRRTGVPRKLVHVERFAL